MLAAPSTQSGGTPAPASDNESDGDTRLAGFRILVVEDESLIAMLIEAGLEDAGAEIVGPCYSVADCLHAAESEEIDGAILDVDLAGEEVFPAAAALQRRSIPFIFHTAHGHRAQLKNEFGGCLVCRKPTSVEELVDAVLGAITEGRPN